jgi:hypothetical protein
MSVSDEFAELEAAVRAALHQQSEAIVPSDQLHQIRSATGETQHSRARAWLVPAAAAAVVLLAGGAVLLTLRPGTAPTPTALTTTTVTIAPEAPAATTTPSTTPTALPSGNGVALPIYYVGSGSTVHPWLLHRDFLPGQNVGDASPAGLAAAAVTVAVSGVDTLGSAIPDYDGLQHPWATGTTASASIGGGELQVVLSQPGRTGLTAEQQRIAVQQVAWTATAAAQQNLPVRITVSGEGPIFESMPEGVYKRPSDTTADLAPIWVTDPSRSTPLRAGTSVVVKGQACVFEANVGWELRQGATVVSSGHTTATSGCPTRGTFSIDLGKLAAGSYSVRAFELSMQDGSLFAQDVLPFTVK